MAVMPVHAAPLLSPHTTPKADAIAVPAAAAAFAEHLAAATSQEQYAASGVGGKEVAATKPEVNAGQDTETVVPT